MRMSHTIWTDRLSLSNATTNIVFYSNGGFHSATAGGSGYSYNIAPNLGSIRPGTYSLIAETDLSGEVAETNENCFPALMEAAEVCSLGQISGRLQEVVGRFRPMV